MSKVVSVLNMKGGVGKTTLTLNIGNELSERGHKVLLIDLDPQSSLTQFYFGIDNSVDIYMNSKPTVVNVFKGDYQNVIYRIDDRLHIIPSSLRLSQVLSDQADIVILGFSDFIERIKAQYDFILIDCPPFESVLNRSTYNVSDYILNPVLVSKFSILGLYLLTESMTRFCNLYKKQIKGGTVINAFDFNNPSFDQAQLLSSIYDGIEDGLKKNERISWDIFNTKITYSKSHLKSINDGTSLSETKYCRFDVKSNFSNFINELLDVLEV